MCGLVGVFGKGLTMVQEKIFRDLIYLDVFRGEHSTGAAIVSSPYNAQGGEEVVEVVKEVGPPSNLYNTHGKYQGRASLTTKANLKLLLGHNRHATQGAISVDNAHPFEMGDVVGAHNGTVAKYYLKSLHEADKYEVDSQIIYSHLGAGNTVQSLWDVADGAMALTWYDKVEKRLRIARNKERPLFVSKSKDGKSLYWASESWMIWIATSRNGMKDIEDPVAIEPDKLYEFSVGEDGLLVSEVTALNPFVPKTVVTTYSGYTPGKSNWSKGTGTGENWSTTNRKNQGFSKPPLYITIEDIVKDGFQPYAFGKTDDGEDIKIIFAKGSSKTCINNVLQRGRSRGVYVTDKYFRVITQAPGNGVLTCNYGDLVYYKKKSVTMGWRGENLSSTEYTKRVKCGCANCQTVPSWASRDDLRWINTEMFLCYNCKDLSWVRDLEENYAM